MPPNADPQAPDRTATARSAPWRCPKCQAPRDAFRTEAAQWTCSSCGTAYPVLLDKPFLLHPDNPIRDYFIEHIGKSAGSAPKSGKGKFKSLFPTPPQRVWTRSCLRAVTRILRENDPASSGKVVMNIGSGTDGVYQKLYAPYPDLLRVGLPLDGRIDAFGDAMDFPLQDNSVDLVLSSSVLEHIEDVERSVADQFRLLKPGGLVYAEIPFLRAWHMEPVDYQRYTWSGIEKLFARHGFETVERGICSGPFTAWALFVQDFLIGMAPGASKFPVRILASWLLHPWKFLDRLVENAPWARKVACNFYFVGRKPAKA